MWTVLITDDEPKIRKSLKSIVDWSKFGMEVTCEAEDGEIAYEMAVELKPDIMLVDICMPFLSGLELIEKLKEALPSCIIIVVTGYDEVSYAQKALRFRVFDYLLKPVGKEQMLDILEKAKNELLHRESKNIDVDWTEQQLKKSRPYLKENFLKDLIIGNLAVAEIKKQLDYYKIYFSDSCGMIIIKTLEKFNKEKVIGEQDRLLSVQNLVEELLDQELDIIFRDGKGNIVIIVPIIKQSDWVILGEKIQQACDKYLNQSVILEQEMIKNGIINIPKTYQGLIENISKNAGFTPVVRLAKEYIDNHYNKGDISLEKVAEGIPISPTYLSRLLKQEIGVSFIEYLTQVRIRKAIQLMNDPAMKIYEIAECVGYNSQHYFCNVFKKLLSMSPEEYRKGGVKS